jgi:hypothetical protein
LFGGDGDDTALNSLDGVVGNDSIDGGLGSDHCTSDPDPTINCRP